MTIKTIKTIEELKAQLLVDSEKAKERIAERKERITLERLINEANDENLQNVKAERELFSESAVSLDVFMANATKAVKDAQLQTRTGSELKLNFYPTKRKHLVIDKLTSLMNSMVYTRSDVSKLVATELGLNEVDVEDYRNAMGSGDSFTPEMGIIKGFVGNAKDYNSNLNMLADKLGLYIPATEFTQEEFDTFYANSVERALEEQKEAEQAEQAWNMDNGHGLTVDMS